MSKRKGRPGGGVEEKLKGLELDLSVLSRLAGEPAPQSTPAAATTEVPAPPAAPPEIQAPAPASLPARPRRRVAAKVDAPPSPEDLPIPESPAPRAFERVPSPEPARLRRTEIAEDPPPLPRPPAPPPPPPEPARPRLLLIALLFVAALAATAAGARQAARAWRTRQAHRSFALPFGPQALLAARPGQLDAVDPARRLVFTLDAEDFRTLAIRKLPGSEPGGAVWGDGRLWTTVPDEEQVVERGPAPGFSLLRVHRLEGRRPVAAAWDGRHLWVADEAARTLVEFAPAGETLAQVREYPLPEGLGGALAASGGLLWLASARKVHRYAAGPALERRDVVDLSARLAPGARVAGLALETGRLWVLASGPQAEVHRVELEAPR